MTKTGYSLIAVGLFLLALNYNLINFSSLSKPLVLPLVFILVGLFSIIKNVFNLGELGDVLSTIFTILIIVTIIANIFNFPSITIYNYNNETFVELNNSGLTAFFTTLDFSTSMGEVVISYEDDGKILTDSMSYSQNYSITTQFSESTYDFANFLGSRLIFENNFGESSLSNLASFNYSRVGNSFGQILVSTGNIVGYKELIINNAFGDAEIIIDKDASYKIESSNAFGTVENNIGLVSSDYDSAANKINIIIDNAFGSVELYKE